MSKHTNSEHPTHRADARNLDGWQREIDQLVAADRRCQAAKVRLATLKRQGRVFYGN